MLSGLHPRRIAAVFLVGTIGLAAGCVGPNLGPPLQRGDTFLPGSETNWTPPPNCPERRTVTVRNQAQLRSAVAKARAGDVIQLANGNYGNASLNLKRSGTKGAPICIRAANVHRAVFSSLRVTYSANYVTVMNLKVNGGKVGFDMPSGSNFRLHGNHFNSISPSGKYLIDVDYSGRSNVNFRWDSNLFTNFRGRLMRSDAADAYSDLPDGVVRKPRPNRTPRNMYFDHNFVQWRKGQPKIGGGFDDSHAFKIGGDVGNDADQNLHVSYNTFRDYPGGTSLFLHWKSSGNYFAYNKLINAGGMAGVGARSGGENKIVGNVVQGAGAWFQIDDRNNLVEGNYVINHGRTYYGVGSVFMHGNIGGSDSFGILRNGSNRYTNAYKFQRTVSSVVRNNVFISNGAMAVGVSRGSGARNMLPAKNLFSGNLFHNLTSGVATSKDLSRLNGNRFVNNYWSNFSRVPQRNKTFDGSGLTLNPEIVTVKFSLDTNRQVPNRTGPGTRP